MGIADDPRFDWCREQLAKPTRAPTIHEDGARYRVDCPDDARSVWFATLGEAIDYSEREWRRVDKIRQRWRDRLNT